MYLFYSLTSRKRHFLWMVLSVFLLFQDINASVMQFGTINSMLNDDGDDDGDDDFTDVNEEDRELKKVATNEIGERNLETLRSFKVTDCKGGWAVKKNGKCDCAPTPAACEKDYSGMVCASNGVKYKSMCHFSWEVCKEKIKSNVNIAPVCKEQCKYLRLQGGSVLKDKDPKVGLGIFTYVSGSSKTNLLYKAGEMELYYETNKLLTGWNIGKRVKGQKQVVMRFMDSKNTNWPQEVGGAEIVPQTGGKKWTLDGTLRLVCIKDMPRIHKRFFFLIALVVSLTVTAVATTLQVVQMVKGCLYTDLCSVRSEIESLQPKVRRKQEEFEHDFGKGDAYKSKVDSLKTITGRINANLARLEDMLKKIKYEKEKNMADASALVKNIVVDSQTIMGPFLQFEASMKMNVIMQGVNLGIAVIETVYLVVKVVVSVVKTATLAVAAVFSIIGAIFAIIDIAHSVSEEKAKYREAVENRDKLREADTNLNSAKTKMTDVQKKLKSNLVDKMKDFSKKANGLISSNNLRTANSKLNTINYYSDLTIIKLDTVLTGLEAINSFAEEYYNQLKVEYDKQKQATDYARNLEKSLKTDKADPDVAFTSYKSQRPALLRNKYNTFPEFMAYLAKDVLKTVSCYWGYNLVAFRQGKGDIKRVEMCDSPELSKYTSKIKSMVQQSDPVCSIKAAMPNKNHFSSTFQILSYIAKYVLPSESCYYGYDLSKIRNKSWKPEQMEDSKVDKRIVDWMKKATQSNDMREVRSMSCSMVKICLPAHFNYIGCMVKDKFKLPSSWNFGSCTASTKCTNQLSQTKRC